MLLAGRWRSDSGAAVFLLGSLFVAEVTLSQTIRPASHAGEARASLAVPAESAAHDGGPVFLAAPYEFWTLNGLQFWADDVQFALETECATTATDIVIGSLDDPRLAAWRQVAIDDELGRGLFVGDSGQGAAGPWSGSRSIAISVIEVSAFDGLITAVLDVSNLDGERPLLLGDVLVLFARWSESGKMIEETPIELLGVVSVAPEDEGRQLIEFQAPEVVRGRSVSLMFDVRDPKRGWLSDCDQSTFSQVELAVD